MNDKYLYRAKRTDNGEWIVGSLIQTSYLGSIRSWISCEQEDKARLREISSNKAVWRAFEVRTDTICQCTGLRDKNGKLIWENDVVCTPYVDPIFGDIVNDEILDDYTWKVVFVDGGFCVENEDNIINLRSFTNGNHIKAIGNIFDNPELLEK